MNAPNRPTPHFIDAIDQWWTSNLKATDKLEGSFPELHAELVVASDEIRDGLSAKVAA